MLDCENSEFDLQDHGYTDLYALVKHILEADEEVLTSAMHVTTNWQSSMKSK